jgi:anti-sigma regulatory factor (Ser/Thr protein kinase)
LAVKTQESAVESGEHVVQFYEHGAEAPGRARRLAVAALRQWSHDESLVQDAALVLSELATNAVVHAGSAFSVAVRAQESVLRVAVQDARPLDVAVPERVDAGAPAQGAATGRGLIARTGHGLGLVDMLARSWGVEASASGKVVWAEIPYAVSAGGSRSSGA